MSSKTEHTDNPLGPWVFLAISILQQSPSLPKRERKLILDSETFLGKFITSMAGWLMRTLQLNPEGPDGLVWKDGSSTSGASRHKTPSLPPQLKIKTGKRLKRGKD